MHAEISHFEIELHVTQGTQRLDQALLEALRARTLHLSRNQLKELFEEKRVLISGTPRPASWTLLPGTHRVTMTNWTRASEKALPSNQGSFLPIAYEDDSLLVLNKASGVPSLPHSPDETETAVGSALAHFHALSGIGHGALEPGLLHRLDTGTSGLLAFAKSEEAYAQYHEAWKTGGVRKIYRAWVEGNTDALVLPKALDLTLAHHPESRKRMIVLPDAPKRIKHRGKPLKTQTIIKSCFNIDHSHGKSFSDLEIEIITGVMHQIRCSLAHLTLPIAGDPIYNPKSAIKTRLMLHAWKLILNNSKGKELEIVAPLPSDFSIRT